MNKDAKELQEELLVLEATLREYERWDDPKQVSAKITAQQALIENAQREIASIRERSRVAPRRREDTIDRINKMKKDIRIAENRAKIAELMRLAARLEG